MTRGRAAAWIALSALFAPTAAVAQQEGGFQPVDGPTAATAGPGPTAAAPYPGVVPGRGSTPPRARQLGRSRHNMVIWPGFEMTGSGSRVFVQTTRPVTYRRADEASRIVLVLEDTRIHLQNNTNPLVTEHFNTPVARAYLRRSRGTTLLVLEMKVPVEPSIRQASEGEYNFLFLEFPSGSYPTPAGTTPSQVYTAPGASSRDQDITVHAVD